MHIDKFDKVAHRLSRKLIASGLKPHVQNLVRDFAGAMADKHDLPSNAQGFDVLRFVFQSVHDNADRHTALRTLIQMIDAIDANPNKLISPPARKLAVAHFETTLKQQEPFPPERELAMGVQLFTRVASTKYTKLTIANHVKDTAHRAAADLPEQSGGALETIRDFLLNHEAEQRTNLKVLKLRPRRKFIEPVSVLPCDNA